MPQKKELQFAYGLAIVLLVVGILSYAAFPAKALDQPVRLMFKVVAGNVLFDHKTHVVESGYGLSCFDCHHHPEEDESALRACGDCHSTSEASVKTEKTCSECHEDPEEYEGSEPPKRAEAFHSQCIDCHKEYGAGAVECSACHVL